MSNERAMFGKQQKKEREEFRKYAKYVIFLISNVPYIKYVFETSYCFNSFITSKHRNCYTIRLAWQLINSPLQFYHFLLFSFQRKETQVLSRHKEVKKISDLILLRLAVSNRSVVYTNSSQRRGAVTCLTWLEWSANAVL